MKKQNKQRQNQKKMITATAVGTWKRNKKKHRLKVLSPTVLSRRPLPRKYALSQRLHMVVIGLYIKRNTGLMRLKKVKKNSSTKKIIIKASVLRLKMMNPKIRSNIFR